MYPFLFRLDVFGLSIHPPTYGILLALAFSAAYIEGMRQAFRVGEKPKHIENLFLVVVICSIFGSRLFHVLFEEFSYYASHPLKIFAVWEGGYTLYGAMIAAFSGLVIYCKRHKLNFRQFSDIAAPSTALGIFIGRLGCFAAGCCWGRPTNGAFGVVFSHPESFAGVKGVPLHPAQLYESIGALLLYIFLIWRFRHRKYKGQITFEGLIIYSTLRFVVEFFRGDDYRGYAFGGSLSYGQVVSLIILPLALGGIFYYSKKGR